MVSQTKADIETDLWERYGRTRSVDDRNRLVEFYLPIVGRIIRRFPRRETVFGFHDTFNSGVIGLIGAVERFDVGRGLQFGSFAAWRIHGAIADFIRSTDWVPRSVRRSGDDVVCHEQLEDGGSKDTAWDIIPDGRPDWAESVDAVDALEWLMAYGLSGRSGGGPDNEVLRHQRKHRWCRALYLRYGEGLTLKEVGEQIGISQERARQVIYRGLRKARMAFGLDPYDPSADAT